LADQLERLAEIAKDESKQGPPQLAASFGFKAGYRIFSTRKPRQLFDAI
jgi:hypothetical protein